MIPIELLRGVPTEPSGWRIHILARPDGPTLCDTPIFDGDPYPDPRTITEEVAARLCCVPCAQAVGRITNFDYLVEAWQAGTLDLDELK